MDYKKLYQEKLVTAEQAASVVKSGDWVDYGGRQSPRLLLTGLLQKECLNLPMCT